MVTLNELFQIGVKCLITPSSEAKKVNVKVSIVPVTENKFTASIDTGAVDELIAILSQGSKKLYHIDGLV